MTLAIPVMPPRGGGGGGGGVGNTKHTCCGSTPLAAAGLLGEDALIASLSPIVSGPTDSALQPSLRFIKSVCIITMIHIPCLGPTRDKFRFSSDGVVQ